MSSDSVQLRGVDTVVRRWGDAGPTVVVAHSAGLDSRSAHWIGAALAERGAQVVALDLRGHGGSSAMPERVSLAEIALDLAELPSALGLDRPHLLGTSLGGAVASLAVRDAPAAFASLTIVCSPDRGYPAFIDRADRAEAGMMPEVIAETMERWFTEQQLDGAGPAVALARASLESMDVAKWAALWRDFARFGGHPDLRGVVPVLCIAAASDRSTPPEVMARAAAALGSELLVVDDAPHQALMTHAQELARLWMARHG